MKSFKGFTIIELSVSLFVVSVLLTGIVSSLAVHVERRRVVETKRQLDEVREALIGFAIANKRLPRPADAYGHEISNCTTDAACTGNIPWATLAVPKLDAFDKVIRYSVTPVLANAVGNAINGITLTSIGNKDVYSSSQSTAISGDVANNAMAVIWSHGNRNFGSFTDGTLVANASTGNLDEIANISGSIGSGQAGTRFVSHVPSKADYRDAANSATGEFDDIVVWLPTATVIARLTAAGRIP
jgi:prepilin-type N-terminal cleavage/methylation domain-containing protein